MASANPPLPLPETSISAAPSSLWRRQSRNIKQGIKTGLAGAIAYAIYAGWNLPQGYWAVITALVVTQATLGAAWKAAFNRTIGSTAGAIAAALVVPLLGTGATRTGIALFLLASLFGYLAALHPSFTAAGFTVALILVFSSRQEPWELAWYRVLYTILGAFVAFGVGALLWPVKAREELRAKLANILEGCATLYRAVSEAAIAGVHNKEEIQQLNRRLHEVRSGITQQMDEAKSELSFSRFNPGAYQELVDRTDQIRRRLTAMAEDASLYVHAEVQPELVRALPRLIDKTAEAFLSVADATRTKKVQLNAEELEAAVSTLDADISQLRQERVTAPFALDRMLPFWALIFNLREIALDLKQMESILPRLA
jgi:uncharacterized membrane protein YccC